MELHERLYSLGEAFGSQVFDDPDSFRGALDDYLDEGAASTGDINLLADAVRLGAFRRMREMLANGATPMAAVDAAGELLSRERGSADVAGSRWACAVLGYATGDISGADVRQYRTNPSDLQDIRGTNRRPTTPSDDFSLPGSATAGGGSWPGDATAGTGPPPRSPTAGAGSPPPPEWPTLEPERPPRRGKRAGIVGVVVGALLLSGAVAVAAVLASRSSDNAGDKPSQGSSASAQPTQSRSKNTAAARRLAQLSRVSYDGDKLSDVAIQPFEGLPADIQVMRSDGHALVPSTTPWARLGLPVGPSIHRLNGDFNGDQKTDMAVIEPDGDSQQVSVLLSSGSSFGRGRGNRTYPRCSQRATIPSAATSTATGRWTWQLWACVSA